MRRIIPATDNGVRKTCSRCGKERPIGDFQKDRQRKDGHSSQCKYCESERDTQKRNVPGHKELRRAQHLLRRYKITDEQYQELFAQQDGKCACCGRTETNKHYGKAYPLSVDHCHQTGKVRGLLCVECNSALGSLHDSPERVLALLAYLKKHIPAEDLLGEVNQPN